MRKQIPKGLKAMTEEREGGVRVDGEGGGGRCERWWLLKPRWRIRGSCSRSDTVPDGKCKWRNKNGRNFKRKKV